MGGWAYLQVPVDDVGGLEELEGEEELVDKGLNVFVGELLGGEDELVQVGVHVLEDLFEGKWVGGWVGWVEENEAVGIRCCGLLGGGWVER